MAYIAVLNAQCLYTFLVTNTDSAGHVNNLIVVIGFWTKINKLLRTGCQDRELLKLCKSFFPIFNFVLLPLITLFFWLEIIFRSVLNI